jgi:putative addiction module killer protein
LQHKKRPKNQKTGKGKPSAGTSILEPTVCCWVSGTGEKPVKDWLAWIKNHDLQSFKQVDKLIGMLRSEGQNLGMPYARHLGDGLFELRDPRQGGPGYRVYYHWEGVLLVILLIAGDKASQEKDIRTAYTRMKDEV